MSERIVLYTVTVKVHSDGALSVEGPMDRKAYMISVLENAIDAVRNQGRPKTEIVVPSKDVKLE